MRPTAHTFDQVNWDNAEQETRIGALQEMVAILLNRLDEDEAASPAALDVERLNLAAYRTPEKRGESRKEWLTRVATEYARLSRPAGEQNR